MSELVANCPRCGAKAMTFDVISAQPISKIYYSWQRRYEAFSICRGCKRSTVFVLNQKESQDSETLERNGLVGLTIAVNRYMTVERYISLRDITKSPPPQYLPENIEAAFREGAACMSIGCFNAAGTMFRLCIDLATKKMLPKDDVEGLNSATRRNLGLRLPWLFDKNILPEALRELSTCIKDDGNDGAHDGTLGEEDAEDIMDFTYAMLERIYTEPARIKIAKERRDARHKSTS